MTTSQTPGATPSSDDDWADAFDAASGRSSDADLDAQMVSRVRQILDARRTGLHNEPCPPAVLARIQGLVPAAARPSLLQMVFDSLTAETAAARGSSGRMLRFEQGDIELDVRVRQGSYDDVHLDIAAQGLSAGISLSVLAPPEDTLELSLDADGVGTITLPRSVPAFVLIVVRDGSPLAQSEPVALT